MKYLIVARHGEIGRSNDEYRINSFGRLQIEQLTESIMDQEPYSDGDVIEMFSSPSGYVVDSADHMSGCLGLDPSHIIKHQVFSDSRFKYGALRKIRATSADGIIVMTHLDVSSGLPQLFYQEEFKDEREFEQLKNGHAYFIDLEKRECRLLPSGKVYNGTDQD
jgi:hypothetical protein